ncbi:MAG TPA: hypothetical protein VFV67_23365 [Actinophytocola sp.]|uniref:hypothetical protein n=1 Tax=Actinophytocola sp. TaxID=1872138 RepID=UPI002DB79917|nr:hypothetical protein [Actinophytocola sp.]HEU5473597.1 hypothetical protein [Actinophytocola sp.]
MVVVDGTVVDIGGVVVDGKVVDIGGVVVDGRVVDTGGVVVDGRVVDIGGVEVVGTVVDIGGVVVDGRVVGRVVDIGGVVGFVLGEVESPVPAATIRSITDRHSTEAVSYDCAPAHSPVPNRSTSAVRPPGYRSATERTPVIVSSTVGTRTGLAEAATP